MPSIKRQLAARVAGATGLERGTVNLVLRAFYQETLRAANERLKGGRGGLSVQGVGRFWARASGRGCRHPATGGPLGPHWAFWFKPYKALVGRCAEICSSRRG